MLFSEQNRTITTDRLVLRLFETLDAEEVTRLCNNYNIYQNTLYLPYPYTVQDALTWMERHLENYQANKAYEFAITDRETGVLYGAIALSNNKSFRHGEIAYWVGEGYWKNGYATEAAEAIKQFAFQEKGYHKIFARYFGSNLASGRVLEKLGMVQEGILKDHVRKEDRYEDLVYCGMINTYH